MTISTDKAIWELGQALGLAHALDRGPFAIIVDSREVTQYAGEIREMRETTLSRLAELCNCLYRAARALGVPIEALNDLAPPPRAEETP